MIKISNHINPLITDHWSCCFHLIILALFPWLSWHNNIPEHPWKKINFTVHDPHLQSHHHIIAISYLDPLIIRHQLSCWKNSLKVRSFHVVSCKLVVTNKSTSNRTNHTSWLVNCLFGLLFASLTCWLLRFCDYHGGLDQWSCHDCLIVHTWLYFKLKTGVLWRQLKLSWRLQFTLS